MASKINQFRVQKGKNLDYIRALKWMVEMVALFVIKYIFNPILVGLILYGGDAIGKQRTRVASSVSIITTSYLYLSSISRFPSIGRYTNMLTKVGQLVNILIQMATIILIGACQAKHIKSYSSFVGNVYSRNVLSDLYVSFNVLCNRVPYSLTQQRCVFQHI